MIRIRSGKVNRLLMSGPEIAEIAVIVEGSEERAINYYHLTGPVKPGDEVILNTTAVFKQLGTGGTHFVMANLSNCKKDLSLLAGHIMKVRYTPAQVKVLAVEEEEHPQNHLFKATSSLPGTPVVIGSLHSMLGPAAAVIRKLTSGRATVVYLMTDGGSLPIFFSRQVAELKEKGLISATVTCGHAFGGDYEAVTVYSGLLAARGVAGADVIIAAMGPGIVGSGSEFGFTGLEQGELVNAVHILGGRAIAIPRISFADSRQRHKGLSHHTRTALGRVALTSCVITLPEMEEEKKEYIRKQLFDSGLSTKHQIIWLDASVTLEVLREYELQVTTMGRSPNQDPEFFLAAGAAGVYAARLINEEKDRCSR